MADLLRDDQTDVFGRPIKLGRADDLPVPDQPSKEWIMKTLKPLKLKATWSEEASHYVDQYIRMNAPTVTRIL